MLISIFPVFQKHKMYVRHIHSDMKDNNSSCTDETEQFNQKRKNPTPIFTLHEEPELSSGEENDALLTKRPFSAVKSMQSF